MSADRRRRSARSGMPGEEVPPVPVGEALGEIAATLGLPEPGVLGALTGHWADIVGPAVAAHARPRSLRRGVLTIVVDAPSWATQLRYLEADVMGRARAVLGSDAVAEVRVVVDPAGDGR